MKKSIISIILAITLIITSCPVQVRASDSDTLNSSIVSGYDTEGEALGAMLNNMMEEWLNDPSYDKVTIHDSSDVQNYYSKIVFNVLDENIVYHDSLLRSIVQAIFNYPNLCTAHTSISGTLTTINGQKIFKTIIINSPVSSTEIRNVTLEYKKKLNTLINSIPSSLSKSTAKILYLHEKIAGAGDYDMEAYLNNNNKQSQLPIGVLMNEKGVCQSYAIIMNHATLAIGIPSIVVISNNHTWNAVQIDSNWYYIDVTWDDISKTTNNYIGQIKHNYFLVNYSDLSADDDSTFPHAIDSDFYNTYGSITDSIKTSYPNAVPKSENSSEGIRKAMNYLNDRWYYCDAGSIYKWDGTSEYGTKVSGLTEIVNCSVFENTLYYAKSDGIYQYIDGVNDSKLNDLIATDITDMIIVDDTLKYVDNGTRKEYSLAAFSTATPTPAPTATPVITVAPTLEPTATPVVTVAPTVKPTATPVVTVAPTIKPTAAPVVTVAPTIKPTATPVVTVAPTVKPTATPVVTVAPTVKPTTAPIVTVAPTVKPTAAPIITVSPTVKPTVAPVVTVAPTIKPTTAPVVTAAPTIKPTVAPIITVSPAPQSTVSPEPEDDLKETETPDDNNIAKKLKKGSKITDKNSKAVYKIIGTGKNKTVEYTRSTKKNAVNITIPKQIKINGSVYKVTSIGKEAFYQKTKLQKVTIGKNIKKIGNMAFYGCKKLKTISIGKNVTSIGNKAFYKCSALVYIKIPAKVKKIGSESFYGCSNLRYVLVKTNKLTQANVGKNVFGAGYSSPRVKTDESKWKLYAQIFLSEGMSNNALFVIDPVDLII